MSRFRFLLPSARRRTVAVALTALTLATAAVGGEAKALVLLDEDFSGAAIANNKTINLKDNPGNTANDNLNTWVDFPDSNRWGIGSGGLGCAASALCDGSYAQHLVQTSDSTNVIYYGVSGSGLGVGTTLTLDFSYIASNRSGSAYILGLRNGLHELDPALTVFPDGDDGVELAKATLSRTSLWSQASLSVTLTETYDVFAIAFIMGGTTGDRAIDNVLFQAATVPEPGALAILAVGLVGLGLAARRIKRAA